MPNKIFNKIPFILVPGGGVSMNSTVACLITGILLISLKKIRKDYVTMSLTLLHFILWAFQARFDNEQFMFIEICIVFTTMVTYELFILSVSNHYKLLKIYNDSY